MKREDLDEWAAKFMGEEGEEVADAVASKWYTSSPAAAFAVMNKMANEGKKVEVEIENSGVKVECGEAVEEGKIDNLGMLMVTACYRCANG